MTIKKASGSDVALWISIGLPLSLIVALALGLISLLNFFVYQKTYKDLNIARLSVVARDLRESIENGLSLGLSPQANTELGGTVNQLKEHTEGLRFIVIVDEKANRVVGAGGADANQDWSKRLHAEAWSGEDHQTYQIGLPFRNSFGVVIGAVIVGYDKEQLAVAMKKMARSLTIDWAYAVGVISAFLLSGTWFLTRRLREDLKQAETLLQNTFHRLPDSISLPSLGVELEHSLIDFMQKLRGVAEQIERSLKKSSRS